MRAVSWTIAAESSDLSWLQAITGAVIASVSTLFASITGWRLITPWRRNLELRLDLAENAAREVEEERLARDGIISKIGARRYADDENVTSDVRHALSIISSASLGNYTRRSSSQGAFSLREARSVVNQRTISFYSFLTASVGGALTLFYGIYLLMSGSTDDAVATLVASVVPDALAALFLRVSTLAGRRAEAALGRIDREIQRENTLERTIAISAAIGGKQERERLRSAAALRAAFPDATPGEIAKLLEIILLPHSNTNEQQP